MTKGELMDDGSEESEELLEDLGQQVYSVWDGDNETPWASLPEGLRDRYRLLGKFFHKKYSEEFSEDIEFAEKSVEVAEEDAAELRRELDAVRDLSARNAQSFVEAQARFERTNKHGEWLAMALVVTWFAVILYALFSPRPAAPLTPSISSNDDGYVVISDEGVPTRVPWPSVTDYPAERFIADCEQVCAVPERLAADPEYRSTPGRVLVSDPEHLACTCFHPGSHFPIDRYVGWSRVR